MDCKLGISLCEIEGLSIRQKREIIKKRAAEIHKIKANKFKYHKRGMGTTMLERRLANYEKSPFTNS